MSALAVNAVVVLSPVNVSVTVNISVSFSRSKMYALLVPGAPAIILLPSLLNLTLSFEVPVIVSGAHAKLGL